MEHPASPPRSCLVVGAGIAGLFAATQLASRGVAVTVLERGAVGGRMATQQLGEAVFDAGAQFFTVRHRRFDRFVRRWLALGIVERWSRGFNQMDGFARYRGRPSMQTIPRVLAQKLDVCPGEDVFLINVLDGQWKVQTHRGGVFSSDALILTPPAPVALALSQSGNASLPATTQEALAAIRYAPCLALLARLDRPSCLPPPGAVQVNSEPIHWIADNEQKGISPVSGVTIHAGPRFSHQHLNADPALVADRLLNAAARWLADAQVEEYVVKRWPYSRPVQLHRRRYLQVEMNPPLLFAGDGFGEARVEGAALSGLAAADALLKRWT